MTVARTWGSTAEERRASYPCDDLVPGANDAAFRAIEVAAPAAVVFRWFCQLKVAPYSYDLIDNFGRRSPRKLTPGAERLEVGQRFMTLFTLAEFVPGREITLVPVPGSPFSNIAVTYRAVPIGEGSSRIVVKIARRTSFGRVARAMIWGDLLMMHRQLNVLKGLAERSHGALPFIDRHSVDVIASRVAVWSALMPVMEGALGGDRIKRRFARAVGVRDLDTPTVGFHIERSEAPHRLVFAGSHRFSRYTLTLELDPIGEATRLSAVTHASFPGIAGQAYKTLVIRSRAHVLATRSMLDAVRIRAERSP